MPEAWKTCAACKKPIPHGAAYWTCSVSTCNRARFQPVFCSLACWDSHVAVMNHRNAWADEHRAPTEAEAKRLAAGEGTKRRIVPRGRPAAEDRPVLIVASRLKAYIKDKSGMNTSAEVLEVLSDIVRAEADRAIDEARRHGRRTVMARDFR